jgi:hypothetical protein
VAVVAEMIAGRRDAPPGWRAVSKSIFASGAAQAALK